MQSNDLKSTITDVDVRGVDALIAELDRKMREPGRYASQEATEFVRRWKGNTEALRMTDKLSAQTTVEVVVPTGYRSAQEFLDDCGLQRADRAPIASTAEMRARIRELASPPRDDFDAAVLIVLDDFDRLEARTNVR